MRNSRKPCAREECPEYLQPDAATQARYCSTRCRMKVYRANKKKKDHG